MTAPGWSRRSCRVLKDVPAPNDLKAAILKIVGSPDMCSGAGCGSSMTSLIGSNTAQIPGGDAGVVRIRGKKAIAVSTDVTPRYVEADPFEGGKQAVAECWRNLTAVGADPIAITDNLNFGNPERPEIMGQFVQGHQGHRRKPAARSTSPSSPATSRSTTRPTARASCPRPPSAASACSPISTKMATLAFKAAGDAILLVGGHGTPSGPVDLSPRGAGPRRRRAAAGRSGCREAQRRLRARTSSTPRQVTAVHDISDGGLGLAVIEMALASRPWRQPRCPRPTSSSSARTRRAMSSPAHPPQAAGDPRRRAARPASPWTAIGTVTAEATLKIAGGPSISVAELRSAHEGWFPAYMAGEL